MRAPPACQTLMLEDGFWDIPPGKLVALVTYLVHDLDKAPADPLPEGHALVRLRGVNYARYLTLFKAVGQDWLWFGRLRLPEEALIALLDDAAVLAFALTCRGEDIGLLELDFRNPLEPELAYFGLTPGATGKGLGRALMGEALRLARTRGAAKLHVHTCSLDHPAALRFYVASGFKPVRRGIEVFDDPRQNGTLPQEAAAFLPMIVKG